MIFSKAMLSVHDTSDLLKFINDEECSFLQVERINIILNRNHTNEAVLYYISNGEVCSEVFNRQETDLYNQTYDDGIYELDGNRFYYYYPQFSEHPAYKNISHYRRMPLNTVTHQLGEIEFINPEIDDMEDEEKHFRLINSMLISFVAHVIEHELATSKAQQLSHERDNYHILVDVTNAVISQSSKETLLNSLLRCLNQHFSMCDLSLIEKYQGHYIQHSSRLDKDELVYQCHFFSDDSVFEPAVTSDEPVCLSGQKLRQVFYRKNTIELNESVDQVIIIPMVFRTCKVGYITYVMQKCVEAQWCKIELLQQVAARVAMAMHSLSVHEAHTKVIPKNEYISIEAHDERHQIFDDIISQSEAMNRVLDQVAMVADCDSTVLILGETGTGKELIARAIHKMSRRSKKRMVKMNCAAVPEGLFESELFGHERGAFTGAIHQRVGRFEQANQGTLFLDEIGDMPLELQPKLLRVLQESEIERVGKNQLIPVDVRIVVATNADLVSMVQKKTFRNDLYYRLNIFPIEIPPLRERPEDIPLLVKYFSRVISKQMGKKITAITNETMRALADFSWPGNVRQLRNFIERSVILTRGDVLNAPLEELVKLGLHISPPESDSPLLRNSNAREFPVVVDREAIIQALRESNGIVAGVRGAAVKLGLKRTTLLSRMQKMGISSKDYLPEM
ncbi:sigma 54-interacting transcriptional regulator [Vibrio quintilis]|uniref:Formate hydrogenlyase transcriptional activator n=1 Tax=Vibrio quintilis TaxID=1117707 RepID=A0A1M7YSJ5_9VIBR|nr:sigma 54-interacting transcriptional regulator [Vibrio quintilis]SHO55593.1 Formate hydrogenlyase transcriptional activator [Vibrio quintilis]